MLGGAAFFGGRRLSFVISVILLGIAASGEAVASPSAIDQCVELYQLWARYESHSTFHSGQKARAEFALQCDCFQGRHASGMGEFRKMLQRGLVPIPER